MAEFLKPQASFFSKIDASSFPFGLASDNHSGTHPRILKTLEIVNRGFAPSYGTDIVTEEAVRIFRQHFGEKTAVHFCFNGTAANVLALAPLANSYHAIICTDVAHINVDECSAPEKHLGLKLITVSTPDGKLTPAMIEPLLVRRGDQHFAQSKVVSITQPTEFGTVYSRNEIREIAELCKRHGLWLHVDGARFINAATVQNCELGEVAPLADVISFGGTKNGLMFGEAVLFISDAARLAAKDFHFIRKQFMQLPSKTRFIGAQFIELLGTNLWREISENSCERARQLRAGLEAVAASAPEGTIQFTRKTEANAVFAIFEPSLEKAIKKSAFFYNWDEKTRECRLMTSWSTTELDVENILRITETHTAGLG